jgi:hypothetical protein
MGLDYDSTHDEEYAEWLRNRDRRTRAQEDEELDDLLDRADEARKIGRGE